MRVAIVGAGAAGLACARRLLGADIDIVVFERAAECCGVWNYDRSQGRMYRSTHTISSKPLTEFPDFPLPADYPDYPHHTQVLAYLRAYAQRYDLLRHVRFGVEVRSARPVEPDGWDVDGERFDALVVASGHNTQPRLPDIPGEFGGALLHSSAYRTPDPFIDRRVLVVGAGNSGCDIAVEAAQVARRTLLSMRRGYHYVPKYLLGRPVDQIGEWMLRLHLPLALRRWITRQAVRFAAGTPARVGLPEPDHAFLETHPIVNTLLPYWVQHGRIEPKPDVERFDGARVRFRDGSDAEVDVVVLATGYEPVFPFLPDGAVEWRDGRPDLRALVFHPRWPMLFFAGLIQTDSGVFGLLDLQARAIALALAARRDGRPGVRDSAVARLLADDRAFRGRIAYQPSRRHALEVDHWVYGRALRRLSRMLERGATVAPRVR